MKRGKKPNDSSSFEVPGVDLAQLERLLAFMSEHGLEEFEYAYGELRIRLKKAPAADSGSRFLPRAESTIHSLPQPVIDAPSTSTGRSAESSRTAPPAAVPAADSSPAPAPEAGLHFIKSPIVGTFYSAASPEAPPFVKVGDRIEVGHVVCIIEAMKLMNEIEADVGGEVAEVLIESGQPVEYGESLFAIRPAAGK
jgi:acetyl-CoA carboxylase biotin carboxyl carrier protein